MEQSISFKIGKGSISHNARMFFAENVDPDRTQFNIEYISKDIKQVYHELFDEAVKKYNAKQVRSDRTISNYYEKIRTGKQEKVFHEVIVQVGNMESMNVQGENGELAKSILNEYMLDFQNRNPYLYVFSAHLHMDEQTPHLHIDFVPFTTESKRGLETRVSLKQALKKQGFIGNNKSDTEWNKWVRSEKETLAKVMEKYDVVWKDLGTHNEPLDVLNFKKSKRQEEIIELENKINVLEDHFTSLQNEIPLIEKTNNEIKTEDLWLLPEPKRLTLASTYNNEITKPKLAQIRSLITPLINKVVELARKVKDLRATILPLKLEVNRLNETVSKLFSENQKLKYNMRKLTRYFGKEMIDNVLSNKVVTPKKRKEKSR